MDKKLKIIIVDDHDMFREGVKVLLGKDQKIEIIGEASNGKEFLELLESKEPDVVLMDISMPVLDGIEATRQAIQLKPDLKILTLSMFGEEEYYYKMIHSGVRGFIMKSAGIDELEYAIYQIAAGSAYFSEELLDIVKQNVKKAETDISIQGLTNQEISLLKSLALNHQDNEIAQDMNMPVDTIIEMRKSLQNKTGLINTSGLIMYAIKNKIIEV